MLAQLFLTWCPVSRVRSLPPTGKLLFQAPCLANSSRLFTQSHVLLKRKKKKSPSFAPSPEQQKVVHLCRTQNVVASARPGSGKTATAEAIVAAHRDERVVVLTYSKRLQLETQNRLKKYSNRDVFTFHGMASRLFGDIINNDAKLSEQRRVISERKELPQWNFEPYDIIVLDEVQDCSEFLFWLINCFIQGNEQARHGQSARLVVLGDERQSIYRYRGSDQRFLTLAPELFGPISPYPFVKVSLSQSFRLSQQTAQFVNQAFLGGESYIASSKTGPKPIVLRCNPFQTSALAKVLMPLIRQYGASNSAILAPSIRNNEPCKRLTNMLSGNHGVPIAVSIDDDAPLDDRVIAGKLCVSTVHHFKGSERDLIILFGTDNSFFQHIGRDLPDDKCPNETFVALTRAAKQLVLIHNDENNLMPFVSVKALYDTADVINLTGNGAEILPPAIPGRALKTQLNLPKKNFVRDMTRHLQDEALETISFRELSVRQLSPPLPKAEHIDILNVVQSDKLQNFHEAVSDINGLVVVAAFEHSLTGTLKSLGLGDEPYAIPSNYTQEIISWLCRRACKYEADFSGYKPRSIQMRNHAYDWMKPEHLEIARSRLQGELRDGYTKLKFEVNGQTGIHIDNETAILHGRADIVTGSSTSDESVNSIWEIKFVSQLSTEHIIQACTYAYVLTSENEKLPRIILYNVKDGEKLEITSRNGREGLRNMVESVLRIKYTAKEEMSDDEFLEMCEKTRMEVANLRGPRQDTDRPSQTEQAILTFTEKDSGDK